MNNIDITALKARASGQCREIVLSLAPHLAPMIERGNLHGPCPLCGGKDRARCYNDFDKTGGVYCNQCGQQNADLFATLQWANGWTFPQTIDAVAGFLGQSEGYNLPLHRKAKPSAQGKQHKDWPEERQRLQAIWDGATQDTGRIAEYFQSRGITVSVPTTLRLHPHLFYFHKGPEARYQAILAEIIRDGKTIGVHQTWLSPDGPGKADVSQPRKSRKCAESLSGGSIRLFGLEPGTPLVLCEGIETAISVRQITGLAVWSCINSTMLEKVQLPDSIREVYIGVDKDKSGAGQRAAERLSKRLVAEGRKVQIALPPGPIPEGQKSLDWNDVLAIEVTHGG
jgi:putative DNA primase/helicase